MAENKVEKSTGAIVFLDLLGVKGGWRNADQMITQWDTLIDVTNALAKNLKKDFGFEINTYSFSDTLVMTAPATQNLVEVVRDLVYFWCVMLPEAFLNQLLFRGCISVGDYYTSKSKRMLIGPAIDEAVQYHALADWLGVSLSPSANILINEELRAKKISVVGLVKYAIPLKGGIESDGLAVNWIGENGEKLKDSILTLRNNFISEIKKTADVPVAMKYRNTINFIDYVIREHKLRITTEKAL